VQRHWGRSVPAAFEKQERPSCSQGSGWSMDRAEVTAAHSMPWRHCGKLWWILSGSCFPGSSLDVRAAKATHPASGSNKT
jgi:hypothetical protein